MGKGFSSRNLPFEIEPGAAIQKQLVDKFKDAVASMKLMPGQLLPSSRELAEMFGIARATAVRVYKDLIALGYIETIEGKGTFVRRRLAIEAAPSTSPIQVSNFANHLMQLQVEKLTAHDFPELNHGSSPADYLPVAQWKSALLESCRSLQSDDIEYGTEPFGFLPLREEIAAYLNRARMIECSVDNLVLCASSTYLLSLIAEILLEPGQSVVFPEPGPLYAREIFHSLGVDIVHVPVDENGLVVDELRKLSDAPAIVYLNSSHHDPTGACMSMERRKALVNWLDECDALVIEDDYDADYRYNAPPLPPLRAMSAGVIYISNFWRTLYPLVNLSYAVVPAPLAPIVTQAWHLNQHSFHTHLPFFDQRALVSLLKSGEYEKHVHRNQSVFATRYRTCVHELTKVFGEHAQFHIESSSYHLLVRFLANVDNDVIARCASEAGITLLDASKYYEGEAPSGLFLLPFAYVDDENLGASMSAFRHNLNHEVRSKQLWS